MEVLSDLLGQLSNAKTEVLFGVALYVIGAVLKRIPAIPNVVIPVVLVFIVGPVVGYFIFDNPGAADFQLKHPEFRAVMIGMIIAAVVNFFWVTGKAVFDSVFLSAGINFMFFDYAIAWWLIWRKTKGHPGIEPPRGVVYHWFSYLSGSPFDSIWRGWDPVVRCAIRAIVLGLAIYIYIVKV